MDSARTPVERSLSFGAPPGVRRRRPGDDRAPRPVLVPPGVIWNGQPARGFGALGTGRDYPDVRSFRHRFALVIPATNTSMEHELWDLIVRNHGRAGLQGVGLTTTRVVTPRPTFDSPQAIAEYRTQFLGGLESAVTAARLAEPDSLILGMSLEHVVEGLEAIRASIRDLQASTPFPWATWHDAAAAALRQYGARRIGLLTPFDAAGNRRAERLFGDLGFEVVASVGFACAHAAHIAHVPDWAKERAILEMLAPDAGAVDAIVQCGTNMSLIQVAERLEPVVGIPILGVNAVMLWYALRQAGIEGPISGGGRLLRECWAGAQAGTPCST